MADFITGYQYSPDDGRFIGEYKFPNNLDKEAIHVPPFTTLVPPPAGDHNDVAFWRGDAWELVIVPNEPYIPPIEDYALITNGFIDYLKATGRWTESDQKLREEALANQAAEMQGVIRAT